MRKLVIFLQWIENHGKIDSSGGGFTCCLSYTLKQELLKVTGCDVSETAAVYEQVTNEKIPIKSGDINYDITVKQVLDRKRPMTAQSSDYSSMTLQTTNSWVSPSWPFYKMLMISR